MIRPKYETENLLFSNTKKCETLMKETHRKADETLEFELTKSRETFRTNPLISIEASWMIRLTALEVYISIFNMTKQNKKFELYADVYNEFTFMKLEEELDEIFDNTDIALNQLQDEKTGPLSI